MKPTEPDPPAPRGRCCPSCGSGMVYESVLAGTTIRLVCPARCKIKNGRPASVAAHPRRSLGSDSPTARVPEDRSHV
jgi:hypothetical protein